jgi:hypothetical protein
MHFSKIASYGFIINFKFSHLYTSEILIICVNQHFFNILPLFIILFSFKFTCFKNKLLKNFVLLIYLTTCKLHKSL